MNSMEEALIRSGANIAFKTVKQHGPTRTESLLKALEAMAKKTKQNVKKCKQQRMVRGIPRDPCNKTAALVTSPQPKT